MLLDQELSLNQSENYFELQHSIKRIKEVTLYLQIVIIILLYCILHEGGYGDSIDYLIYLIISEGIFIFLSSLILVIFISLFPYKSIPIIERFSRSFWLSILINHVIFVSACIFLLGWFYSGNGLSELY